MGRAIAEAVGRCIPKAAAQVHSRVWLSWICGGQSGTWEDPVYRQHQELVPTLDRHESPTDALTTATATDED
jgi:hypothetical protein